MILKDLYNELEKEALMQEPYAYSVKQTNQIIRKHFKMLDYLIAGIGMWLLLK